MTEWNANEYHRRSDLQRAMAAEQLATLTLRGDERVLDVGCGAGGVTSQIADRVPGGAVVGVDPSHDMIAFATRTFATSAHPNLRFEVGDARRLPALGKFDLAVSFNALHWVREQEEALRSIRAALRPGGRAVLRFVPEGARHSLEDVIELVRQEPKWAGYFSTFRQPFAHYTPEEYATMAKQAGWRVEQIQVVNQDWDFGTHEAFVGFCQATFVEWTRFVPEGVRDAFIADVLTQYRPVAAEPGIGPETFRFLQMEVHLIA